MTLPKRSRLRGRCSHRDRDLPLPASATEHPRFRRSQRTRENHRRNYNDRNFRHHHSSKMGDGVTLPDGPALSIVAPYTTGGCKRRESAGPPSHIRLAITAEVRFLGRQRWRKSRVCADQESPRPAGSICTRTSAISGTTSRMCARTFVAISCESATLMRGSTSTWRSTWCRSPVFRA
jgi:hypothetical protein